MSKRAAFIYLSLIFALLALVAGWYIASFLNREADSLSFDGSRAYADVQAQVAFGARTPGSAGHAQVRAWMRTELESAGWTVEIHETERMGQPIFNVIAKRSDAPPEIILGAHYDTRFFADNAPAPSLRDQPVPGANDGASGVAVLLELARTLPEDTVPVWLVFFDAEDNGRTEGWDWILGSRAFVEEIDVAPRAVVIVDMIGDADLNIHLERISDPNLRACIWQTAAKLGFGNVLLLIDFDYPYWHTTQDTVDKVSPESLHAVGDTLWHWVREQTP